MILPPGPDGSYRYVPGVFQYSAGVVAAPGHELVHVRFASPVPLAEGFERIGAHLTAQGRPLTAFAACELRSPEPFSEAGFRAFNEIYVGTLEHWGILIDGANPVARSNVCPKLAPPPGPSFYAFTYTRPADCSPTAVVAGSGEVEEGHATYAGHVVAPGDVSPAGMLEKARYVAAEMTRRLAALGLAPGDVTCAQVYSVEPIHNVIEPVLIPSGLAGHGLAWHYCRPPLEGLAFEMDCRRTLTEHVLS